MESDAIIEPVVCPTIFPDDLPDNPLEPRGKRAFEFGHVDILGREPEIAGQHQRRTTIDGDLQFGSRHNRGATDPVKSVEQTRRGQKSCSSAPQAKSAPNARINGTKSGNEVAMMAMSSTLTGASEARPITSADIAIR